MSHGEHQEAHLDIEERHAVGSWWERLQQLPSFRASVSDLLTADEFDAMNAHGSKIKDRIKVKQAEYLRAYPPIKY